MGQAIGDFLPSAAGVAISPFPIVAMVLMLVTPRGRVNGPLFLVGWVVGLSLLGAIVLSLAGGSGTASDGGPATWVDWLFLLLGLALLLLAAKQWRGRPRGSEEAPTPKWMGALDHFTPLKSTGAGALFSAVNPKNFLLALAGAAAIAEADLSTGQEVASYAVFVAIASLGVGIPVAIYFVMGERAKGILEAIKDWMAQNNAVIMTVLLLLIGLKLIGNAISGFSA